MNVSTRLSVLRLVVSILRHFFFIRMDDNKYTWDTFFQVFVPLGLSWSNFKGCKKPKVPFGGVNRFLRYVPVPGGATLLQIISVFRASEMGKYFEINGESQKAIEDYATANGCTVPGQDQYFRVKSIHSSKEEEYLRLSTGQKFPFAVIGNFGHMNPAIFFINFMYLFTIFRKVPRYYCGGSIYLGENHDRRKGYLVVRFKMRLNEQVDCKQRHVRRDQLFGLPQHRSEIICEYHPDEVVNTTQAICLPVLLPK